MNREVSLSKRVLTSKGLRYCPVVTSKNGRIKPDVVIVDGKEEQHPEGAYYISWYVGRKLMRLSVGKDAADASARRLSKEADLRSCSGDDDSESNDARSAQATLINRRIIDAIDGYLSETKMTRTAATHSAYELALRNFTDSCSENFSQ
jgi:integrase/recombinase XerD